MRVATIGTDEERIGGLLRELVAKVEAEAEAAAAKAKAEASCAASPVAAPPQSTPHTVAAPLPSAKLHGVPGASADDPWDVEAADRAEDDRLLRDELGLLETSLE